MVLWGWEHQNLSSEAVVRSPKPTASPSFFDSLWQKQKLQSQCRSDPAPNPTILPSTASSRTSCGTLGFDKANRARIGISSAGKSDTCVRFEPKASAISISLRAVRSFHPNSRSSHGNQSPCSCSCLLVIFLYQQPIRQANSSN